MRQPGHLLVAFSGSDSRYGLKVLSKVLLLYCGLLHITAVFVQCFLQAFHVEQICTTGTYLVREFRCYEVKIEESEKAGSRWESNPGHLELPVLCHWATVTGQPPAFTIFYMCCTGGTECLSHTPGSHSVFSSHKIQIPLFPAWGKMLWTRYISGMSFDFVLYIHWYFNHLYSYLVSP